MRPANWVVGLSALLVLGQSARAIAQDASLVVRADVPECRDPMTPSYKDKAGTIHPCTQTVLTAKGTADSVSDAETRIMTAIEVMRKALLQAISTEVFRDAVVADLEDAQSAKDNAKPKTTDEIDQARTAMLDKLVAELLPKVMAELAKKPASGPSPEPSPSPTTQR